MIVNVNPFGLVPPPGPGLKTVTIAIPGEAINDAGTVAEICVAVIEVAARVVVPAAVFQWTTDPVAAFDGFVGGMKLLPVMVSVKSLPPAFV